MVRASARAKRQEKAVRVSAPGRRVNSRARPRISPSAPSSMAAASRMADKSPWSGTLAARAAGSGKGSSGASVSHSMGRHSSSTSTARSRSRPRPLPYRPASSAGGRSGGGAASLRGLRSRKNRPAGGSSSSTPGMSRSNRRVSSETSTPSCSNICSAYASALRLRCSMPAWRGGVSSSGNSSTLSETGGCPVLGRGGGGRASSSSASSSGPSRSSPPGASGAGVGKGTTFSGGGGRRLASGQGRSGPEGFGPEPNSAKISSSVNSAASVSLFSLSSRSFDIPEFLAFLMRYYGSSRWRTAS